MTSVSPATPLRNRRPKENDWRLFLRLVPYARRHRRLLTISTLR